MTEVVPIDPDHVAFAMRPGLGLRRVTGGAGISPLLGSGLRLFPGFRGGFRFGGGLGFFVRLRHGGPSRQRQNISQPQTALSAARWRHSYEFPQELFPRARTCLRRRANLCRNPIGAAH